MTLPMIVSRRAVLVLRLFGIVGMVVLIPPMLLAAHRGYDLVTFGLGLLWCFSVALGGVEA